jgi:hypothetical protein
MNPVSTTNPVPATSPTGIQALTQQVTNELSTLPIQLPAGALTNATPADLVKLSSAAMLYQETTALFTDPNSTDGTSNTNSSLDSLLASIGSPSQQTANSSSQNSLQNEALLLGLPSTSSSAQTPTQSLLSILDPTAAQNTASADPLQSLFNPTATSTNGLNVLG